MHRRLLLRPLMPAAVAALVLGGLSACMPGGAPTASGAGGGSSLTIVKDVWDLKNAYDRAEHVPALDDRCGDGYTFTGGPGAPGSDMTCAATGNAHLFVRWIACRPDQSVDCSEKAVTDPASTMRDKAYDETGSVGFCYVQGNGNWAVATGYGISEFSSYPTKPSCVEAKQIVAAMTPALASEPTASPTRSKPAATPTGVSGGAEDGVNPQTYLDQIANAQNCGDLQAALEAITPLLIPGPNKQKKPPLYAYFDQLQQMLNDRSATLRCKFVSDMSKTGGHYEPQS